METSKPQTARVLLHVHRLAAVGLPAPDAGTLLRQFVAHGDQAAFAQLVHHYRRLVYSVCNRVLENPHDADDAFQATFLVFARKAASIRHGQAISTWLYRVAHRTACMARSQIASRQSRESSLTNQEPVPVYSSDTLTDQQGSTLLRSVIDDEVSRLPRKYQAPVVLCYLQGKTAAEAAAELGWHKGTVFGRLSRARDFRGHRGK